MEVFIYVLILLVCVFLALIVLVQNPKGGGLDSSLSGANQIGGVKRTADFLEKSTWSLAILLFVLCLVSAGMQDQNPTEAAPTQFEETELPEPNIPSQSQGENQNPDGGAAPVEDMPEEEPGS
ncbi:MAG TPA: preprotein translocase subunit SecG [Cryomorphaceae bacterium]|nr:preprotein translocase subunit SecG [Cryomorphaceae bacterium]